MIATIVGRFACEGEADLPAVAALQAQLTLTPLEPAGATTPPGVPSAGSGLPEAIAFYERVRVWAAAFPPSAAEQRLQQRFGDLGLLDRHSSLADAPSELSAALDAGFSAGREQLEAATRGGADGAPGAWSSLVHLFDYNVDALELGTLDTPQWKLPDRADAHTKRAIAARVGLWGNHAYEAFYAQVYDDADGRQLNGAHRYELRFETLPPVDAFWSLTMYDTPGYFLVANPLGRYSIGDRTPGLHYAADGSLTLVMQREAPEDPDRRANWLPTPAGDFRPLMRLYQPREEVLDGSYRLPPIVRTG